MKRAQTRNDDSFKKAVDGLDKIATDGQQQQIQKVLKGVHDNVDKSLNTPSGNDKSGD